VAKELPRDVRETGAVGPCARLTREVLDRLASPEVRDAIIRSSLSNADLSEIPEDPATFGSWACGALRDTVELTLGEDAASAVIADLSPAFGTDTDKAASGVRRRKRASLAAPSEGAPVVVVASSDPIAVDQIVGRLKDRAKVIAAYDVFALLSAVSQQRQPITLLLNDDMQAMRPSTVATLERVLAPGARVIAWGAAGLGPERREPSKLLDWIGLGNVEDVDAVADMCIALWPDVPASVSEQTPKKVALRTVVVAHNDARWRAHVSRLLTDAGYVAISAPDGFMALERCIDDEPSAVIAAYAMDTLDGPALASLLRSRFGDDAPPVLLVADSPLPAPPAGVMAVILNGAVEDDLLPELASWIG
jgi:CheY-like chemotaxis protein